MGIVTGRIWIMNCHIRTHPISYKGVRNKIRQQLFPLCFVQLNRQSDHKFTGKAAVFCLFIFFYGVPKHAPFFPF